MHRFYVIALRASVVSLMATPLSTPALAQGGAPNGQSLPFEGIWAKTPTPEGCKAAGEVYTRTYTRSTADANNQCKVTSLYKQADGSFMMISNCSDGIGHFNRKEKIEVNGNSMTTTSQQGMGSSTYQRCAGDPSIYPGPPSTQQQAAASPPPAKSQAPGEVGLFCNITVSGARQDWYISVDLNQGLYTARVNNAVVRQRKAAIMDVVLGNTPTPQPGQLRLQVDFGISMYMAIKPNNQVFLTAPSGGNAIPAGSCKDTAFQGL